MAVLPAVAGRGADEARPAVAPVSVNVASTTESWSVVRGGVSHRWVLDSLVDATAHLSLAPWGGPARSAVIAQVHWAADTTDESFSAATGAFNPVSNIMAEDHLRLYNLHYRQDLGAWSFKVGQLAVDDDFMLSEYAGLFLNAAFGAMPSQVGAPLADERGSSTGFPIYSVAAPGLWVEWRASDTTAWQLGLYHGFPGADRRENRGFDWSDANPDAVAVLIEPRTRWAFVGRAVTSRFGVAAHTGKLPEYAAAPADHDRNRGFFSAYTVHDIALITDQAGVVRVGGFVRAGVAPQSDRGAVRTYVDAGLNGFGVLPSRGDDVAGIAVSRTSFHDAYRRFVDGVAAETTVELTYQARVTRRISLQADLQWLFAPKPNAQTGRRETAFVCGVRTRVVF